MIAQLLTCVMDLGEQLLVNGAEIYRVEECINRVFNAYEVKRVDTFIISSSMVVSVTDGEEVYTQTRRINFVGTNIEKLHRLNDLSRQICKYKYSVEKIRSELDLISNKTPSYSLFLRAFANAIISGSFTLFFGGNHIEAVISFVIGFVLQFIYFSLGKLKTNRLFEKLLCSLTVSLLAFFAVKLSWVSAVDKIIIGNIMSMIPGIGFTNAIRDLFKGDIFAGVHRLIESLLISAAIASGYVIPAMLIGGFVI
jgi:uncharacterized membrane protein YjjP (DUF1212 family)